MIAYELLECLREMQKKFDMQYDVIPINHLDTFQIVRYPLVLTVNTDPDDAPGKHWTVLFQKTQYAELEGFCSLGIPLVNYGRSFVNFIRRRGLYSQNTRAFQGRNSGECGKFCLMYIYCRLQGIPRQKIYTKFSNDLRKNDVIVNRFFMRNIFNSILKKRLKHVFINKNKA